jgi:hypothetical protein
MWTLKLIALQLIFLPAPILFDLLSGADLFGAEVCSVFLSTAYVFFVSVLVIFVLAQLAPPLHQGLTFANLLFHSRRSVAEDASRLCLCRLLFCFAAHEPGTPDLIFCSKTELLALQHLSLTLFVCLIWSPRSAPVSYAAQVHLLAQGRRSILFQWHVLCDFDCVRSVVE